MARSPRALAFALPLVLLGLVAAPARAQSGYVSPPPDEAKDSGLGLEWVYLNADAGYGYANMTSFSSTTMGLAQTASGGPAFGVAAGVRVLFFSLGARVRNIALSDPGDLWEFDGEAAFHIRIWHIDPYFGVRGGYNFVGALSGSSVSVATGNAPSDVNIHGFNIGPMLGIDYYFAKNISLGADLDAQFLFITRPPVPIHLPPGVTQAQFNKSLTPTQQQLYQNSGSSAGIQITPTVHLGVHF